MNKLLEKNYFKRTLPIAFIGLYISFKLVIEADESYIFDFFGYVFWGFIFIVLFIYSVYNDCRDYFDTGKIKSFVTTFTALFFIALVGLINYVLEQRDSSPIIIQAVYDGGYNGIRMDFREDNTYKISEGSGLGGESYRGTYKLKDNVIILDNPIIEKVIESNYLEIKSIQYADSSYHDYIFQINPEDSSIIDKDYSFLVEWDSRKK